ncbi:hypothetical protein [Marinomonas ostreistagni]|uniref:Prepilin-type N-terminal cleavage/methylation domain-containing protein n=1 Tax=Marinomonas ostreistagni TaxID=359209 RepID=A0ABS0ZAF7_9GAMM|nr:hypothetical protein [Marinomonas ostreistagni]MBJ7550636.1 hypothetical protein [Marinomonas ostreistagni]
MVSQYQKGYLLLEVLIVMAILIGLLGLLTPILDDFQKSMASRQKILELMMLEKNIADQLSAQFKRVGRYGCKAPNFMIQVGSSETVPSRIERYDIADGADWLYGFDLGACSTFGVARNGVLELPSVCHDVQVGDSLFAGSCDALRSVKVLSINHEKTLMEWPDNTIDSEVHVYTQESFYWFVQPGKTGRNALWRRPSIKGNALELAPGVEHLRISLLLDNNFDGKADEIVNKPHTVAYQKLVGFLIEFHYRLPLCDPVPLTLVYQSLRGDEWRYDNICSGIGKLLVASRD